MNEPRLEDRLHGLADHVVAPASLDARAAIGRRTGHLRRRRARNRVIAAGVVAMVVVVAGASLVDSGTELETGPASSTDDLAALTLDLDGWNVTDTDYDQTLVHADGDGDGDGYDITSPDFVGGFQVFREPGEAAGPVVFVVHMSASDTVVPGDGQESVQIAGTTGALTEEGRLLQLDWNPPGADSAAVLIAWDLTPDEVVGMASAAVVRDPDVGFPAQPDARFGLDFPSAALPAGLEEVVLDPGPAEPELRRVELSDGPASVEIVVDDRGSRAFEADSLNRLSAVEVRPVTVAGHDGTAYRDDADDWTVMAQLDDGARLTMTLRGVDDAAGLEEIVAHVREVPADEWGDLLR